MSRERKNIKSKEADMILEAKRMADGMTGEAEKKTIANTLKGAKKNNTVGDKILMVISPYWAHIPEWQRDLNLITARQIGQGYNKNIWDVPKVVLINGVLVCVDGMHRLVGAAIGGIEDVVVEVLEITEQEAIRIFLDQSKNKTNMSQADYYKASIAVGEEKYIRFRDICHKYNVQIKGDFALDTPVGVFTSLSDGIGLANSNPELLDRILNLINELQWNGNEHDGTYNGTAYSAKIIRSLKKLYAYNHKDMDVVDKTLMAQCKGSTWYKENFTAKPQEYMFDTLSRMVDKNKDKVSFIASTKAKRASKTS